MALPVAVQLYSVRDDAKNNLFETLKSIKNMGYDGVEFSELFGHSPTDIREMCEKLELIPLSAHVSYTDMLTNFDSVISDYQTIGCKFLVIPYLQPENRPNTGDFLSVINNVRIIAEKVKQEGMSLLYHNHNFEFVKIGQVYALDMLYGQVPPSLLETELDTCWVRLSGEDPSYYIETYKSRCPLVHLKDFYGTFSEEYGKSRIALNKSPNYFQDLEFRPLGCGLQDIPTILKTSEQCGAQWIVVEQDEASMGLTQMESIQKSRNYLLTLGY